jgi:hypothetical protein
MVGPDRRFSHQSRRREEGAMIFSVMGSNKGGFHQLLGQGLLMERYFNFSSRADVHNDCHNHDPCFHFFEDLNCGYSLKTHSVSFNPVIYYRYVKNNHLSGLCANMGPCILILLLEQSLNVMHRFTYLNISVADP